MQHLIEQFVTRHFDSCRRSSARQRYRQPSPPALQHYQIVDLRGVKEPTDQFNRLAATLAPDLDTGEAVNDEQVGDRLRVSGDPRAALPYYERAFSPGYPSVRRGASGGSCAPQEDGRFVFSVG